MLTTIAVVATLLAITLPAISHVRRSARSAACLANIRTNAQAIETYVTSNAGTLPYIGDRNDLQFSFTNGGYQIPFMSQGFHWAVAATDPATDGRAPQWRFCPDDPVAKELRDPGSPAWSNYPESYVWIGSYDLTEAAFTDPGLWPELPETVADPEAIHYYRAVRAAEIRHPGAKGLLYERVAHHLGADAAQSPLGQLRSDAPPHAGPFATSFADGHAEMARRHDLATGVLAGGGLPSTPVRRTVHGVHGRDLVAGAD